MRDKDVRNALKDSVLANIKLNDASTRIVHELGICQGYSRIDIAAVNGKLWGYEIKSERDTLERLESQINFYGKVFDCVTIIVAEKHLVKAEKIIPSWWGIMSAVQNENTIVIKPLREHKINEQVEPFSIAQLLWKEEALAILEKHSLAKGLKSKPKRVLWKVLAENIEIESLKSHVREALKTRAGWRFDSQLVLSGD